MRHLIDPMDLTVEEIDQLLAVGRRHHPESGKIFRNLQGQKTGYPVLMS